MSDEMTTQRLKFWTKLISSLSKADVHYGCKPTDRISIKVPVRRGVKGVTWGLVVLKDEWKAELLIDQGSNSHNANKAVYDQLLNHSHKSTWRLLNGSTGIGSTTNKEAKSISLVVVAGSVGLKPDGRKYIVRCWTE